MLSYYDMFSSYMTWYPNHFYFNLDARIRKWIHMKHMYYRYRTFALNLDFIRPTITSDCSRTKQSWFLEFGFLIITTTKSTSSSNLLSLSSFKHLHKAVPYHIYNVRTDCWKQLPCFNADLFRTFNISLLHTLDRCYVGLLTAVTLYKFSSSITHL